MGEVIPAGDTPVALPVQPGLQILGYRQVIGLTQGDISRSQAQEEIIVATRRYARAQRTWFRKESPALEFGEIDNAAVEAMAGLVRDTAGSP